MTLETGEGSQWPPLSVNECFISVSKGSKTFLFTLSFKNKYIYF